MSSQPEIEVRLPKLGLQMTKGVVIRWLVSVGDQVQEGDDLLEIETDKVYAVVPAPEAGVVRALLVQPDDEVPVGEVVGILDPVVPA